MENMRVVYSVQVQFQVAGMWNPSHTSEQRADQIELNRLQSFDPQAVSAVYDRYFPIVFRFVRFRLGDDRAAEDISSEVFIRLLEAIKNHKGPHTNLKAWLLATASHAINDDLRKSYRRRDELLNDDLIDLKSLPPEMIEKDEGRKQLRLALTRLTPDQQNVLALRFGEGFSLEETASLMKKNVNAVKQLQFRALAALHRALEDAV